MVPSRSKRPSILLLIASIIVIALSDVVNSAKILCLFPTGSKSHVLGPQTLLKHLASRGHEVTMVSAFPLSKPVKNYRDVYVPIQSGFDTMMSKFMQGGSRNMFRMMPVVAKISMDYNNDTLNSPQFQQLVREERFDLAILGYFMNGFIVGVGSLLKCPVVMYISAGFNQVVNFVGNPQEIASVPHLFLGNKNPMTFMDLVKNTLLSVFEAGFITYIESVTKSYYYYNFPTEKGFPTYEEAKLNISLMLCNAYFTQTVPRPMLPNVIEVGGLQIKSKPDPLPQDIQAWLDGADEHGVIFLSFGSNLKSSSLREDKFEAIIGSLGKLKQRVIWKWDTDQMPRKPANVLIGKWLPQDDILAHRNLKLFITHGGLGSITESMYHGVPIVGIPMFGDQDHNVAQVVEEGWGESVSFDNLTESALTGAIERVLGSERYTQKIQNMATLYKDRPQSALDLATFWVEYVVRHKGARHLHYQGADLNRWQRSLLDVLVFLVAVPFVVFKILGVLLRKLKKQKQKAADANRVSKLKKKY
ncbi:UDP-glycosyltransferase UGT4-like [Wyeomyia smithii]|uniref:UDP-glycosyltransferase UGT4-like n=1 Tax=Wyeomyia smithii TaxID=174621 RepID=UPI002467E403|nr:UDP-glycosyltransferase UGT4-like [Wyeomyia smithii]